MPDFFEVLKTRRSIRAYSEEPVAEADLQELIDLAVLAPTAMNAQPWNFIVVTNQQVLSEVNDRIKQILHERNIAEQMPEENIKAMLRAPEFSIFYRAPALIVITAPKENNIAVYDCQLAAENIFLAAHAKGLGSCYMGFLFFGQDDPTVRGLLHIPEDHSFMAACCVGHPKVFLIEGPQRNAPKIEWVK